MIELGRKTYELNTKDHHLSNKFNRDLELAVHLNLVLKKLDTKIMDSEPLKELVNDWFRAEAKPYFYKRFGI